MMEQTSSVAYNDASVTENTASPAPAGKSNAGEVVSSANGAMADTENTNPAPVNISQQETPVAGENFTGLANSSVDSTQAAGYDSSLNNDGVSITGDGAANIISENGVASAEQPSDDSALSMEEERLWSIVTTNSLDFDAWTALIDETERTSEGNISKIRKVYDAFLVEFPLCYGYWKKYADHEARLGVVDKVAEVYERAVQGVTYSVDMWLHYCVFSIGTYGDPDTIRSHPQQQLLKSEV